MYVHYNGHESDYDEWVGVDRLQSKWLTLHEPVLPTDGKSWTAEWVFRNFEMANR